MTAATTSTVAPTSVAGLTSMSDLVSRVDATTPAATAATTTGAPRVARDDLVLVPASMVGDLLAGIGGSVGSKVGGWLGEKAGQALGDLVSTTVKSIKITPWSVVPAGVSPQNAAPGQTPTEGPDEDLVFVPAGFFGNALASLSGVIGGGIGAIAGNRKLGTQIGRAAAPFARMLPWSVVPAAVAPQDATPGQVPTGPTQDMVFVPAGILGDLFSGAAGLIGKGIGAIAGDAAVGEQIGNAASPFLKMLPWSVVPAGVTPQSVVPGQTPVEGPDEDLILVPAGLIGGILGGLGGSLAGGYIGDLFGGKELGETIGKTLGGVAGGFLPFVVVPASA